MDGLASMAEAPSLIRVEELRHQQQLPDCQCMHCGIATLTFCTCSNCVALGMTACSYHLHQFPKCADLMLSMYPLIAPLPLASSIPLSIHVKELVRPLSGKDLL